MLLVMRVLSIVPLNFKVFVVVLFVIELFSCETGAAMVSSAITRAPCIQLICPVAHTRASDTA
jgi:hypothetical protein